MGEFQAWYQTDADCLDSGFGNACVDGLCTCTPDGGGGVPTPMG